MLKRCVNDFVTYHLGEIFEGLYLTDSVEEIARGLSKWTRWNNQRLFKYLLTFHPLMPGGKKI